MSFYAQLEETFGDRLQVAEPLARHTVARLGGPADVLVTAAHRDGTGRGGHICLGA